MARYVDKASFDAAVNELTQQERLRKGVTRQFGWKPEKVRILRRGVCLVTVRGRFSSPVEFLISDGLLVGFPRKMRWEC